MNILDISDKKFKKLIKQANREEKLSKIDKKYKDPIKARNEAYYLWFLIGVLFIGFVFFAIENIEANSNNLSIAFDNLELIEQNQKLTERWKINMEDHSKVQGVLMDTFDYLSCEQLKEILPTEKYDRWDYSIEEKILSRCN